MHFEITRLDDTEGGTLDRTVVEAASVGEVVEEAASTGDRLYIRPTSTR